MEGDGHQDEHGRLRQPVALCSHLDGDRFGAFPRGRVSGHSTDEKVAPTMSGGADESASRAEWVLPHPASVLHDPGSQIIVVFVPQFSSARSAYAVIFLPVAVGSTSLYSIFLPRLIQPTRNSQVIVTPWR